METNRFTTRNIVILTILLLLVTPIGIIFLLYLFFGKKGVSCGLGCICLPFLLMCLWLGLVIYSNLTPETGEHLHSVDWLSEEASDISFYKSYSYTAYEFKISEDGFRKNANQAWFFQEINQPETIRRYNYISEYDKYAQNHRQYDHQDFTELKQKIKVTVTNGIVAKKRHANGGGYHAVYNRDTGMGYIQTNPR